ncbi:MAG: hypothetical protein IT169_00770 [Bryobacterales bacterium]|nr:hypothetical protein [Bryobacterales bacterium]
MPSHFRRASVTLAVLSCMALWSGCGAARPGRFEAFAAAGTTYTQARGEFLRQSLELYIDRDSLELRKQHAATNLTTESRQQLLTAQDKIVLERMRIVQDLEHHGDILRLYFAALAQLSSAKGVAGAEGAASRLASEIGKLSTNLAAQSIGGAPVGAILSRASGFAVGAFRNRALARHLQENAAIIDRELWLEEEALRLLVEEMIADRNALRNEDRRVTVTVPYRSDSPLPADWDKARRANLMAEAGIAKAQSAQEAARQLRLAFEALSKGGNESGDLTALQSAVDALSRFVANFAQAQSRKP